MVNPLEQAFSGLAQGGYKLVIGLVGGIGSGKSAVAAEFVRHGAKVISGDQLGHEALRQPAIRAQVLERFGAEIATPNGEIDRRKLGAVAFADVRQLRALEALVFPWIKQGLQGQVAAAQRDPAVSLIVVDAAVMLEAGWEMFCDKIVYVDAPLEQRLARLAQQRGWTEQEVQARAQVQMALEDKAARADAAIDNSGPLPALGPQIAQLLKHWGFPIAIRGAFLDNS
jgi:dephospho-CoA kinase